MRPYIVILTLIISSCGFAQNISFSGSDVKSKENYNSYFKSDIRLLASLTFFNDSQTCDYVESNQKCENVCVNYDKAIENIFSDVQLNKSNGQNRNSGKLKTCKENYKKLFSTYSTNNIEGPFLLNIADNKLTKLTYKYNDIVFLEVEFTSNEILKSINYDAKKFDKTLKALKTGDEVDHIYYLGRMYKMHTILEYRLLDQCSKIYDKNSNKCSIVSDILKKSMRIKLENAAKSLRKKYIAKK